MILYTSMPLDQVYPATGDEFSQQMTIPFESGQLIVEPIESGRYRVVRLVSSDVSLYLNQQLSPGAIIDANTLI